jgi:SAM-dependent methyltransferase
MVTNLSHDEARRVYDRVGRLQDTQAFYEDPTTRLLLDHGEFRSASAVFEFGCGTGRFAVKLLEAFLSPSASYLGVDISPKMASIARARLAKYGSRAKVLVTSGGPPSEEPSESCDRFVSNYVMGLLSEGDIRSVVADAHRLLREDGIICLADLSHGTDPISRGVARLWGWVQARKPSLVGGCRPIELAEFLSPADWQIEHQAGVVAWGIPSEALVARRKQAAG